MKGVRFLVVRGSGPTRPAPVADGDERGPVVPAQWYSWLLMGGNNRELGRGVVPFASEAACRQAVGALAATVLRPVMASTGGVLLWSWRVEGPEGPVACGGRTYRRRRECMYAVNTFLAAVTVAQAPPEATRFVKVSWATWRGRDVAGDPATDASTTTDAVSAGLTRLVTPGESA